MNRLEELRAKLRKLTAEMRQITENPAANGEHSTEQSAKFDALKAEADSVEKLIERAAVVDDLERRSGGERITGTGDGKRDQLFAGATLLDVTRAQIDPTFDAGKIKEIDQEMRRLTGRSPQGMLVPHNVFLERRAGQVAANFADGGALVPDQYQSSQYIDRLWASSILTQLGNTTLTGLMGRQVIPGDAGGGSTTWIGENEEPDLSKLQFKQIAISPKTVAAQMVFSRSLAINSNPSIEGLIRNIAAKLVAEAGDLAAISGTGIKDPKGLLNYTELPLLTRTGADNGKAVNTDELIDMTAALDITNSLGGNLKWLTNPKVVRQVMKLKNGEGDYIHLDKLPASLLSYAVGRSTNVPSDLTKGSGTDLSALIFGDWSSLLVGYWSGLDVLVNPYTYAAKGQIALHLFQDMDTGVRHFESFAALKDVVTEA